MIHKIIYYLSSLWWCIWSNIRFKNSIKYNYYIAPTHRVNSVKDIQNVAEIFYSNFEYTKDGEDQLYNAFCPPPQLYKDFLDSKVKDDCDGFHSLLYHSLYNSNVPCALFTVGNGKHGHCVLIFYIDNKWYVIDYHKIFGPFDNIDLAIEAYYDIFAVRTNRKTKHHSLIQYNYKNGKWYLSSEKKLNKQINKESK